jgi:hypothetical protein
VLDTFENLPGSMKWIVDELSDMIVDSWDGPWKAPNLSAKRPKGRSDSDRRIEWKCAQEANSEKGIRIEIYENFSR